MLFARGSDLDGGGTGPVGSGLLPIPRTPLLTEIDSVRTGMAPGSPTDAVLRTSNIGVLSLVMVAMLVAAYFLFNALGVIR